MLPSPLVLPFSKINKSCQVTEIYRTLLISFVIYGDGMGWDEGDGME